MVQPLPSSFVFVLPFLRLTPRYTGTRLLRRPVCNVPESLVDLRSSLVLNFQHSRFLLTVGPYPGSPSPYRKRERGTLEEGQTSGRTGGVVGVFRGMHVLVSSCVVSSRATNRRRPSTTVSRVRSPTSTPSCPGLFSKLRPSRPVRTGWETLFVPTSEVPNTRTHP